tara:strand:- start:1986 stop:2534 length:549 start_codon:yes stop_codon:yes gene_type:complete
MASKHILSLDVIETANCSVLSVIDTSVYTDKIAVECPELLVTVPGFNAPALINVKEGFNLPLNTCSLGIQTTSCDTTINTLPDGIYILKYSVAPNDKVYVEYNHLRTTELLSTYYKKLCELDVNNCEPSSERKDVLAEMYYIRTLIDAAKAKVEFCQSPNEGMELYNFAKTKLKKITCTVCC